MTDKWDKRFMDQAKLYAQWSKDPKHKLGAVIVDENHFLISAGYNGLPRGLEDKDMPKEVKQLRTIHAELNAILNSNKSMQGATIYVYPYSPCAQCAAAIIQKGIKRVVFNGLSNTLSTWGLSQAEALIMFQEAGVKAEIFIEIEGD